MVKGGGGSGTSGGGGGRTPREVGQTTGTGKLSDDPAENILNAEQLKDKAYEDLPPVENANRFIDEEGRVIVGEAGAPEVSNRFNDPLDAREYMLNEVGMPGDVMYRYDLASEQTQLDIANLLANKPDVKYMARGAEGVAVTWGKNKILRLQYEGGEPLPTYNMGKAGVYPDWVRQYGTKASGWYVEQKERIWGTASEAGNYALSSKITNAWEKAGGSSKIRDTLTNTIKRANPRLVPNDAHTGNWGIDFKGRLRAFDPGAFTPPGEPVLKFDLGIQI